jgi:hypothetical protein
MAESKKPLLELSTILEPDVISVDGTPYPVVNLQALSVIEEARLKLISAADPSDEDLQKAQDLFDANVRLVLDVPDDVFAKLKTVHKAKILGAFFNPPTAPAPQPSTVPTAETSTGESKSPASSASTVATP